MTFENSYERDWECRDCDIIYRADVDATPADLPAYCPDCGDHRGWKNKETGRIIR